MKRYSILALLIVVSLLTVSLAEGLNDVELTKLNADELNAFASDIEDELELHHETDSETSNEVLEATKEATESFFAEQGIEISWAWIDYSYSRDWDFFTLSTHIDYTDNNGIKQKPGVYSEVFCESGNYNVYYLLIGTEAVIDRREELPDELWSAQPKGIVNAATGLDLSTASREELEKLKEAIKAEYSTNHAPNSTISDLVLSMTKLEIEQFFMGRGIKVSWPWFDYTYTCDWELYTLKTSIDYKDENGKYQSKDVYAEAYPISNQYSLCFLSVGDEVLIDERDQLPGELNSEVEPELEAEIPAEKEQEKATSPEETAVPEATAVPEQEVTPEVTDIPEVVSEEVAEVSDTAEQEPIRLERGSKGEEVKQLQQRLIALGLLDGSADGDFGKKTAAAVEALQDAHGIEKTGIFTNIEASALSESLKEYAKRAILVAMTNGQSTDVFMADGNAYDTSKFHNYAYTSGMHAALHEDGNWSQTGQDAWHVENIRLKLEGVEDVYMKLVLDVCFDGENFVLSHVSRTMGRLAYLDSNDGSKLNFEEMEPSDSNPFLTVSPDLIREDRGTMAGKDELGAETSTSTSQDTAREDWIGSQFSIWDGHHKQLAELIKKNLNDEKSYKHIETNYIDVTDETVCNMVNDALKGMGLSKRVAVGDLLIITQFSAKNAFNATIKAEAYGIASYSEGTVELIDIR